MIYLYRPENSAFCDEIETQLREMVLAHEVVIVEKPNELTRLGVSEEQKLPLLKENRNFFSGEDAVRTHVRYLEKVKNDWDRFQSDSCFCGDDGSVL